jgi:hypothetical protein
MIRFLNDGFGGTHGVMNHKLREVGMLQRDCPQEHLLLFGPNP